MLDLDARIDFDEIELAAVGVDQELDGAGVLVADGSRPISSAASQIASRNLRIEIPGRRDLHHFLMPPLQRTIALVQMHQVAVLVAQQLHFDMPGPGNEFFQKHVGSCRRPLATSRWACSSCGGQLFRLVDDAHAAAAAAFGGFQAAPDSRAAAASSAASAGSVNGSLLPASTGTSAALAMPGP